MRISITLITSLVVSSCASTESTKNLTDAENNLRSIFSGNIYLSAELDGNTNNDTIEYKKNKDRAIKKASFNCKTPYLKGVEKNLEMLIKDPPENAQSIFFTYIDMLEDNMNKCLKKYGLTGGLVANYKNVSYKFPDYLRKTLPDGINEFAQYFDAKDKVKKERQDNASIIIGAVALAGTAAALTHSDGYSYSDNNSDQAMNSGKFKYITSYSRVGLEPHKIILNKGVDSYLVEIPGCFVGLTSKIIPYGDKLLIDGKLCTVNTPTMY